jgi:hypothetical protein
LKNSRAWAGQRDRPDSPRCGAVLGNWRKQVIEIDGDLYPKSVRVTEQEVQAINLKRQPILRR